MIEPEIFFVDYFSKIDTAVNSVNTILLKQFVDLLIKTKNSKNKLIIVGNGGSSSIASHLTIDCINAAGIKAREEARETQNRLLQEAEDKNSEKKSTPIYKEKKVDDKKKSSRR